MQTLERVHEVFGELCSIRTRDPPANRIQEVAGELCANWI